jgi:4-amino-4-deoxy-L-arabinose transferase-like glycosyltransferase
MPQRIGAPYKLATFMDVARLGRGELLAVLGGLLLAVGLFLPWYRTNPGNPNAEIDGARGTFSGWEAHPILRWPLLAAALAPLVLAWIVARDHQLSWPRGELTGVVAMIAFVLVLYVGIVSRPGSPSGEISLQLGWYVCVLGAVLEIVGGATRAGSTERPRKPPGVL